MITINPYLTFKGNCEEAFNFYSSVFGKPISHLSRLSEMPPQNGLEVPESAKNNIMHIAIQIENDFVLMGCDEWAPNTVNGNNISLSISTGSREEADHIFSKLSQNGKVNMPMGDTFWGSYFGMLTDKYGIDWMVGYDERRENNDQINLTKEEVLSIES
jgi:PhnB protein